MNVLRVLVAALLAGIGAYLAGALWLLVLGLSFAFPSAASTQAFQVASSILRALFHCAGLGLGFFWLATRQVKNLKLHAVAVFVIVSAAYVAFGFAPGGALSIAMQILPIALDSTATDKGMQLLMVGLAVLAVLIGAVVGTAAGRSWKLRRASHHVERVPTLR